MLRATEISLNLSTREHLGYCFITGFPSRLNGFNAVI